MILIVCIILSLTLHLTLLFIQLKNVKFTNKLVANPKLMSTLTINQKYLTEKTYKLGNSLVRLNLMLLVVAVGVSLGIELIHYNLVDLGSFYKISVSAVFSTYAVLTINFLVILKKIT